MSTEYGFVDLDRKREAAALQKLLMEERQVLKDKLLQFGKEHPLIGDLADDAIQAMEHSHLLWAVDDDNDSYCIGVSTALGFHWRDDNGFSSFEDVERFLTVHPNLVIEDDYGTEISTAEFKKACM